MLSVEAQIQSGQLVCPLTHQPLTIKEDVLETADGQHTYPYRHGIPILLPEDQQEAYLNQAQSSMAREYGRIKKPSPLRQKINHWLSRDYRSQASQQAFQQAIIAQPDEALCLAVGGGPHHVHPKLVNLNIGLFANVHVVGDAYQLPYADHAVEAIHCEAVLEHLEFPNRAVAEMYRVLRPDGQVFAATPFMQRFHAYPNHFQNFTEVGHRRLFERAGFEVISSGVCVGPTYAVWGLVARYWYEYVRLPGLRHLLAGGAAAWALLLRPLDLSLNRRPNAHILASTNYAHLVKPG